ncbi:hypothetical protein H0H92_002328, partial [Tricholoma furcatifolium]
SSDNEGIAEDDCEMDSEHGDREGKGPVEEVDNMRTISPEAPGEFERSLADIPENLPTQPSNFNVEVKEPCVESGRARRKRKIPNGIGSLSECLCGENALAGESVVFCSNRGCETQV